MVLIVGAPQKERAYHRYGLVLVQESDSGGRVVLGSSPSKPHSDASLSGSLFSLSGIVFLVFNHIAESIYPNYSGSKNSLSELGAAGQSTTLLWNSQLFVTGILWLLGVYFFLRRSGRGKLAWVLYLLAPIGVILVSLFPVNVNFGIHSIGALMHFVFGGISALFTFKLTRSPFKYFSLVIGAIALLATVAFVSGNNFGLGPGGMERLIVYPVFIWLTMFGGYLMATDH